jgi:AraC-like DNA-binding protein
MPESVSVAFSDAEDFAAAMRAEGFLGLLVTSPKQFSARLTQVSLNGMRLTSVEEQAPRIAFVNVPAEVIVITFSIGGKNRPIFSGIRMTEVELITVSAGETFHARIDGASHWATIRLPAVGLSAYGAALVDGTFPDLSGMRRWRPLAKTARHLRGLHAAAMRVSIQYPQTVVDAEAAHGLEQQLLHAVLECLTEAVPRREIEGQDRDRSTMARFEQILLRAKTKPPTVTEICAELEVPARHLRRLCEEHLGMSPTAYDRLGRMWFVRQRLRSSAGRSEGVSTVAREAGFNDLDRFSVNYRKIFGELPSSTLRGR